MSAPDQTASCASARRGRILAFCAVLHGFTHLYNVALIPLYVRIEQDLGLASLAQATFLMTAMMTAYFLPSYPVGAAIERIGRRRALGWGLVVNGIGFVILSQARSYEAALAGAAVAGFGGSFYHPAATAWIAQLYPTRPGRALGVAGVGANAGFFLGPVYAGWRADAAGWRAPVLELGLLGTAVAFLFLALTREEGDGVSSGRRAVAPTERSAAPSAPAALWLWVAATAAALSLRDFAGCAAASGGSLLLARGHHFSAGATGLILSAVYLAGMIANPLFGALGDRNPLRWLGGLLAASALAVAALPFLKGAWAPIGFFLFGLVFMGNYPVTEGLLMRSVPSTAQSRVMGLFIAIAGPLGNLGHWWAGWVAERLPRGNAPNGYWPLFLGCALLILASLGALPCFRGIRRSVATVSAEADSKPDTTPKP